eukprot:1320549-Amphidinium_carterae.1
MQPLAGQCALGLNHALICFDNYSNLICSGGCHSSSHPPTNDLSKMEVLYSGAQTICQTTTRCLKCKLEAPVAMFWLSCLAVAPPEPCPQLTWPAPCDEILLKRSEDA